MGFKYQPMVYLKPDTKQALNEARLMLSVKAGKEVTYSDTIKTILESYKKELPRHRK